MTIKARNSLIFSIFTIFTFKVACNLLDILVRPILDNNAEIGFFHQPSKTDTKIDIKCFIDKTAPENLHRSFVFKFTMDEKTLV